MLTHNVASLFRSRHGKVTNRVPVFACCGAASDGGEVPPVRRVAAEAAPVDRRGGGPPRQPGRGAGAGGRAAQPDQQPQGEILKNKYFSRISKDFEGF